MKRVNHIHGPPGISGLSILENLSKDKGERPLFLRKTDGIGPMDEEMLIAMRKKEIVTKLLILGATEEVCR